MIRPAGNSVTILGRAGTRLEDVYKDYKCFNYFLSGTQALSALLETLVPEGLINPTIIAPAYTCPDIISAAVFAKCDVTLVDTEKDSFCISSESIKNHYSESTIAVIAPHFCGCQQNTEELVEVCRELGLVLIEDSAQSFGAASAVADYCLLSFGRGKPINVTLGGVIMSKHEIDLTSNRETLSAVSTAVSLCKLLAFNVVSHPLLYGLLVKVAPGLVGQTVYHPPEEPIVMPSLFRRLLRRNIYTQLDSLMQNRMCVSTWSLPGNLKLLESCFNAASSRFPLISDTKEARDKYLEQLGDLGASGMYPTVLTRVSRVPMSAITNAEESFPNAADFAERIWTIPVHDDAKLYELKRKLNNL